MRVSALLLIALPVLLISCKESEEAIPVPVITGFTPASGPVGTVVTISGENFGVGGTENIVTFNNAQATVQSNGSNVIVVEVPSGATSGPISLAVGGKSITSSTSFTVTQIIVPEIDAISPMMGPVGSTITITGSGFNEEPGQNIVKIGDVMVPAVTSAANEITVTVTDDILGGVVTVTTDGHTATGPSFMIGVEAMVASPADFTAGGAYSITVDENDNMYVAGWYTGKFTLAGSTLDGGGIFIAKFDLHSNLLWLKDIDVGNNQPVVLSAGNSGNVFIGGYSGGDVFVSKMTPDGSLTWTKTFDGHNLSGMDVDSSGDIIFTASFSGTVTIGATELTVAGDFSNSDILVVKVDGDDGSPVWAKSFGGLDFDSGKTVSCTPSGDIYVGGLMSDSMEFAGETISSSGDTDGLLLKLNSDGESQWAKLIGGTSGDGVSDVEANGNDGVILTGSYGRTVSFGRSLLISKGGSDFFVAKFNEDGDFSWANGGGSISSDRGSDVEIKTDGTIVLAAQVSDNVNIDNLEVPFGEFGDDSSLILYLNSSGAAISGVIGGSSTPTQGSQHDCSLGLTSDGVPHVVGSFIGEEGTFGSTNVLTNIYGFFFWNVQL